VPLDRKRIDELVELLEQSGAGELAVQEGDRYYRLVRQANGTAAVCAPGAEPGEAALAAPPSAAPEPPPAPELVAITARVVGLFYRTDEPGGEPLVEPGTVVEEGDVLGFIEVLRKPTEIVSPVAGTVAQIFHDDGDGVQYGDPLFTVKPG
jgi:biotin carboxyl carrier protein